MIVQDLLRVYGRSNMSPRCMMKIDLSKAYDTVSWRFVENLLMNLLFPTKFIKWIMACLRSAHYFLILNGRIQGEFERKKGLRQGDPMSPLLFVLTMEYLTRVLLWYNHHSGLNFHPGCKRANLPALCFIDDLILLSKANVKVVSSLLNAFDMFSIASG